MAMAWLAAGGVALALLVRFGRLARRFAAIGLGLIVLAALGGAVSGTALAAYGPLARRDAVVLWKAGPLRAVPVDTPAETETVQLAAGAAGRIDRSYLGWRRVRLGDGRTGWIRRENLLWVWTAAR